MKTPAIPPIKMPEGDTGQTARHIHQRHASTRGQPGVKIISETIRPSFADHIHLNKLENTNTQFQDLAQQIRNVKEAMENIGANLVEMRDALESIVKIFPPYPPGSSERIEALRQFTALRNMIDQLTSPKTNESVDNIMADPDIHPNAGIRDIDLSSSEKRIRIAHQPVHTGKDGLDIPNLPQNSSDQQITVAIDQITAAQKTMENRKIAFISDANGVISRIS